MKKKILRTNLNIEQCKEIFKNKLPVTYKTGKRRRKEIMIIGDMDNSGDFWLAHANRHNERGKDIELSGNFRETGAGTEISYKHIYPLKHKIWCGINLIISIFILVHTVFAVLNRFPNDYFLDSGIITIVFLMITIFNGLTLTRAYSKETAKMMIEIKTLFNCKWES
jgi:hypothetical protein